MQKAGSNADKPAERFDLSSFVRVVRAAGKLYWRDLPWRNIDDPYAVLVSEIMLQQTQVARVERYWERFLAAFPTLDALSAASGAEVLELWQGLGYNRRALALKRAADQCVSEREGRLPETAEELVRLPGIGPATAAGVVAFAFNKPSVYLETNVRAVFLHCLFPHREKVSDKEIAPLVEETCPSSDPRTWYYALLDYGAHLKRELPNPTRRSAHYARQSAFAGSRRQKRAQVLRIVLAHENLPLEEAYARLNEVEAQEGRGEVDRGLFESIVEDLTREGFFSCDGGVLRI